MTFVHAADLHLGASFCGLITSSDVIGSQLVEAVSESYRRIIDICTTRSVDFLILAGDSFNRDEIPYRVQRIFFDGLLRLKDAGIEVYLAMGNHDPMTSWGRRLMLLPDNVHVFDSRNATYYLYRKEGAPLVGLAGRSYETSRESGDLTDGLTRTELVQQVGETPFTIGVLHTGMADVNYAPCTKETLEAADFDYWALGHLHKREIFPEIPAVMPGSPQGLDINENSEHGCYVVTLEEQRRPQVRFVKTDVIAWERPSVHVTGTEAPNELLDLLVTCGEDLLKKHGTSVCVRFRLMGRSSLYNLLKDEQDVRDLCDRVAERCSVGGLWLRVDDIESMVAPKLDYAVLEREGLFPGVVLEQARNMAGDTETVESLIMERFSKHGIARCCEDIDCATTVEVARDLCLDRLMGEEGA